MVRALILSALCLGPAWALPASDPFVEQVAPLLARRCLSCHNDQTSKGGLSIRSAENLSAYVDVVDPEASYLIELITPIDGHAEMPKDADPLAENEIASIEHWIEAGAKTPPGFKIEETVAADLDWWSLKPLTAPPVPGKDHPIDAFLDRRLKQESISPLPAADPNTLIRRISYDLAGLPPTPQEVESFRSAYQDDPSSAWQQLVDRLLEAPTFGEKWGQHWLDVARYAETHGYDKDKPRENAWPYRDYVIDSFNADKPVKEFVREQIAGDVLAADRSQGVVATGFLAAGPWDFIGHVEVGEGKLDGRIAKHLDRDEMTAAVFNVFQSTTIQCAACHHHKFDPIHSEDYYRAQAVFAGIDRANRVHAGLSPEQERQRDRLQRQRRDLSAERDRLEQEVAEEIAERAATIDPRLNTLSEKGQATPPSRHGFHSTISNRQDSAKWIQVDLGRAVELDRIELIACFDNFNNIGEGFGFPFRYKVQVSNQPEFDQTRARTLLDKTARDEPNPGAVPVKIASDGEPIRLIRVTATKLAERKNDYIFALGELKAFGRTAGQNLARNAKVTFSDAIPANARWAPEFVVDGEAYQLQLDSDETKEWHELRKQRDAIERAVRTTEVQTKLSRLDKEIAELGSRIEQFPDGELVYAVASDFKPRGQFKPMRGELRPIHFLHRGDLKSPGGRMLPGAPKLWPSAESQFIETSEYDESKARAELARYVTANDNPLLWRSMANRIWQWTFGRPMVGTPNDFGRMGMKPTHPELLDWLACQLRDDPQQSIKSIVRLLVTSDAYRRSSGAGFDRERIVNNVAIDANNQLLWRANRRRLTAEEIRDTTLFLGGVLRLDDRGGPSFKDFVIKQPQHSPHYEYHLHDPADPASHRRSIYRFVVRSQPQPMLTTLDCADPSISVPQRDESTTALQALTQWNNRLVERMSKRFATELDNDAVETACRKAWSRLPTSRERRLLRELLEKHGKETLCRVILNSNAMVYLD
jgi:hypothetical protein